MTEKDEALKDALAKIRKAYGQEAIINMGGDDDEKFKVEFISTGSVSLDRVLGGGLPRGRMIEVFGLPSSGKSVLGLFLMAKIQRDGGKTVLIDSEFSYSPDFAAKIGVDSSKLLLIQPITAEQALDSLQKLVEASAVDLVVIDSVASLVPQAELEGEIVDQQMALQARVMSKGLRMLIGAVAKSKTIVIFINQLRDKVGVVWGNKSISSGGNALKFYASVRLEIKKGKNITQGDEKDSAVVGNWINVTAVKNKCAPPFKSCEVELYYERGLDLVGDLVDAALVAGVLVKTGNTISFEDVKLGVGRAQVKTYLEENPKVYEKIYETIKLKG